jgi:hypothetical protein
MLHSKAILYIIAFVISFICLGCGGNHCDGVNVKVIEYRGWADSVELTNDTVRVVVVPAIGRIMHYGFIDGQNVLYENPALFGKTLKDAPLEENGEPVWAAFGGDRVWPTEENSFITINGRKRPPDHWLDGLPWKAKVIPDGVIIKSQTSDYCGADVSRKIQLAPTGTKVTIRQRMEKKKLGLKDHLEPIPLTIWNISQVAGAEINLLSLNDKSCFEKGAFFYKWDDIDNLAQNNFTIENDIGVFVTDPVRPQKVGADSPAWIAAIVGQTIMAESFPFDPKQTYPDGGTTASIFTCPDFSELECMSSLKKLKIDETIEHEIEWELYKLPDWARGPAEKRGAAVELLTSKR